METPREFDVVLEPQPEGGYTVYVPDLPGCISEGETEDEALAMIRDAMTGYLGVRQERGWPLPHVEHRTVALA
jgi:predicted RNase H-like HicB family nuclease